MVKKLCIAETNETWTSFASGGTFVVYITKPVVALYHIDFHLLHPPMMDAAMLKSAKPDSDIDSFL